ncbi:MAG: HYR domain-containing protein, partial [Saprospiraceae bacterium]
VVTVEDNSAPTLTCPASVIRCFGNDVVQYPAPVATDNCLGNGGMFDLSAGLPSGAQFPSGVTVTTYTYTDADGNVGSCSFEVTILTELTVVLDTILNDKGGAHVGAVMISPNGSLSPYKFEWYRNNVLLTGETNEDLDSIGHGSYTVIITDEIGCTATAGPFVVDSLVNTTIPEWGNGLLIVPNPTSGDLAVIFPTQLSDDAHFSAYDMTGRLVLQQTAVTPERMDLDLSKLADGLYTVLIRVKGEIIARKIVVSKN